jgi:hypothetical protein
MSDTISSSESANFGNFRIWLIILFFYYIYYILILLHTNEDSNFEKKLTENSGFERFIRPQTKKHRESETKVEVEDYLEIFAERLELKRLSKNKDEWKKFHGT